MKHLTSALAIVALIAFSPATPLEARPIKPGDPKEGTCELVSVGFWVCTKDGRLYWCTSDTYSKDKCQDAPRNKRPTLRNMKLLLTKAV